MAVRLGSRSNLTSVSASIHVDFHSLSVQYSKKMTTDFLISLRIVEEELTKIHTVNQNNIMKKKDNGFHFMGKKNMKIFLSDPI
jgi:hypothetical protein